MKRIITLLILLFTVTSAYSQAYEPVTIKNETIQFGLLIVAIAAIIFTQIQANKQNRIQMFAEYTRRYQDIFLNMPDDIYNGTAEVDERTKRYMRLYFDLCSEEYHLWKGKAVPDNVWSLWVEGMQITCSHQIYRNSWDTIKGEYSREFLLFFEKNVINHKKEL